MKSTDLMPGQSFDSLRQRRELLEVKNALETTQRKLLKTESALESLGGFLAVLPDPIEIVSADLSILFANEASKKLHDIQNIEGTPYDKIVNLGGSKENCPIGRALRENREVIFSSAYESGDVYETSVAPTTLSDGRRAALCLSKPVVLSRVHSPDSAEPEPERVNVSALPAGLDETKLLRRIATLSTRTLDAILDQITDGVIVANGRGGVVLVNQAFCEITGFQADDSIPLAEVLFPDRELACSLDEFVAQTEMERLETTIKDSGGTRIPVEMTASSLPEDNESPAAVLITVRDLRETQEIKDQLIRSLNLSLAGERIATLAHQVNNYLTPAFYHADTLAQREGLDQKTRQSVTIIQNYLNLCHESILMVLSLIRPAVPTPVNMNSLISEMFSKHYLADELRLDNVEIVQRFDTNMVETMGYYVLLQQALVNIIKNAQEAMAEQNGSRRLTIVTESSTATISVRISDNGPGVPPEIQDKIFQLLVSSKPVGKGHGIGLRFTKEVIDKHDGTIELDSQPGCGTTFEICLPIRSPDQADLSPDTGTGAEAGPSENPARTSALPITGRILIIDDEPDILELLSDVLVRQQHAVTTTTDAHDALEKIKINSYDCIICDIKMPDMDGPELSRRVKDEAPELYERMVFITGDIFSDETDIFIQDTDSPCIEKPFTSEQVHEVVQGVLLAQVNRETHGPTQSSTSSADDVKETL